MPLISKSINSCMHGLRTCIVSFNWYSCYHLKYLHLSNNSTIKVKAGTDPEKYQRGWLAQKFRSCNCHNKVQFTPYTIWCKTVTTDGMAMLVGLTGRKWVNWSKIQYCQNRVGGNNVCIPLCAWQLKQESFLF